MKKLGYYIRKTWETSRAYLFATVLRNLFVALISLLDVVGIGIVVDALMSGKPYGDVVLVILIYLAVNLAVVLGGHLLALCESRAVRKASNVLQYGYMQDCLDVDYHYVQDREILNLKRNSMKAHPVFSLDAFGSCIQSLVKILGVASVFTFFSQRFLLILLAISALLIALTLFTQSCDYKFSNERADDDRKLQYLYEVMTKYQFAKEVRIGGADAYIESKYKSVFATFFGKLKGLLRKKCFLDVLSVVLSCLQSAAMYLYFSRQVTTGEIRLSEYVVLVASTALFTTSFLALFRQIGRIRNTLKASDLYRKYEELLKNNRTLQDSNALPSLDIDIRTADLVFDDVSFCYPGASSDTLKHINLTIPAGKKVGIVGLNGSGKTTLIKLILRLYQPSSGKITLGGIDISEIPYRDYADYLGVMLQDFSLFAYSVRENIIFDRKPDEKRLRTCIEESGLSEKIAALPYGMETSVYRELDDNGIEFSGGEGQKLAMARALYKNAGILLLDEPTSALDAIAEQTLFSRLGELATGKTTVFITHRISSTVFCDKIAVVERGEIVEVGTHSELMEKHGCYETLFRAQAKYYQKKEDAAL